MKQKLMTNGYMFKALLMGILGIIVFMAVATIPSEVQPYKAVSFTIGSIGLLIATHCGYRLFLSRRHNATSSGADMLVGMIGMLIFLIGIIWYQSM